MQVTNTRTTYTFAATEFEPFLKVRGGERYDLLVDTVLVEVHVVDGALAGVGTTWEGRGFAVTQSGETTKRRSTMSGNNLASLPADMRAAIKAAFTEAAGPVADPRGQLGGLFHRTQKANR